VKDESDKEGSRQITAKIKAVLSHNAPDDKSVRDALAKDTTVLEPAEAKYVLKRIANYMQDPEKQVAVGDTNIEHVYPQNPAETDWGGKANQEKLEPLTWHIGNLTVFGRRANRKVENFDYSVKRPKYEASQVVMTKEIASKYSQWGEQEILARGADLAKRAVEVWNFDNPSRV
jgi:hypothetical protein